MEGSERLSFMSERAKTYAFAFDVALGNHEGASEKVWSQVDAMLSQVKVAHIHTSSEQ